MLELIIERWTNANGTTAFLWSAWDGGRRVAMGPGGYPDGEACEAEALAFCQRELGRRPDRVTRL